MKFLLNLIVFTLIFFFTFFFGNILIDLVEIGHINKVELYVVLNIIFGFYVGFAEKRILSTFTVFIVMLTFVDLSKYLIFTSALVGLYIRLIYRYPNIWK